MGGFAFQVACLRLVANEPLFGVWNKIWNKNFFTVGEQEVFYYESTDGPKFVSLVTPDLNALEM